MARYARANATAMADMMLRVPRIPMLPIIKPINRERSPLGIAALSVTNTADTSPVSAGPPAMLPHLAGRAGSDSTAASSTITIATIRSAVHGRHPGGATRTRRGITSTGRNNRRYEEIENGTHIVRRIPHVRRRMAHTMISE